MEEKLTTIIAIRDWLREQEFATRHTSQGLSQFAIDWIEEQVDHAEDILESTEITVDDVTFVGATHYRAENIVEVLRPDAPCYKFFVELARLTSSPTHQTVVYTEAGP
jgi:hypothetical protein